MDDDQALDRARRRGKRVVLGAFVLFAAAFVIISTADIVAALFGAPSPGDANARAPSAPCASAIARFNTAVDGALAQAAPATTPDEAGERFAAALDSDPVTTLVFASCPLTSTADGDAYAAAQRLRRSAEAAARRTAADLAPRRREALAPGAPSAASR